MEQATAGAPPDRADPAPGLRERRRIRTKLMVQAEALRLFTTKGYEQTTVDDIAHAAAMSPRTFFRYFPTKEDVVLWDEYDDLPVGEILDGEPSDDPLVRVTTCIRSILAKVYAKDPALLLAKTKLSFTEPAIRARFLDQQFTLLGPYYERVATALGLPADDLRLQVTLAAVFAALLVMIERWQHDDGRDDLMRLYDEAMTALASGVAHLKNVLPG